MHERVIQNNIENGVNKCYIQQQRQIKETKEGIVFATGCKERNCPCELWVNCRLYNNNIFKDLHPEIFNIELHNWYDNFFRIKYEHYDGFGNG